MLVAGVDDAGRGSVIGPLVIAGVVLDELDLPKLVKLNVKDSKLLSPHRREVLAPEIKCTVRNYAVERLFPRDIDKVVTNGRKLRKLNWLEAKTMAKVIENLKPHKAYVDASDVLEERFKRDILECLPFRIPIVSEHKADRNYPVVSAASIIAKVERDKEIAQLAEVYGDFGSGYPSDSVTMDFLKHCLDGKDEYPEFVRRSWEPAKKTKSEKRLPQSKLM